ncbi:hypothetical protein [Paenibacillus dendritiformis]|uniref:Uncharacterized protein n=1 Tax=Paenibacillus dendritiformis C454 TaxID=1131935 RepID=H3SHX0_9BACL|nr:hypothetical protein [Paenibacillus dendritiformis]EHQ61365.1 hypothetical protein PDENDC454_15687 [Paenibacillus dendritiformis C454]CAH8770271.1 hypothetical protein H7S4_003006 [Paenibacillus dendritiformis]
MASIRLNRLRPSGASGSYIEAMHAILAHAGWIDCSPSTLAGMTASCFRFTVNRRLTEESATAYNWMAEHFVAGEFIGVTTSQHAGFSFQATFPLYQKRAVSLLASSIAKGRGGVFWKDRFVIATGYDDARRLLYYADGSSREESVMSYDEFGRNESPYWYVQIFESQVAADPIDVYKESLIQAVFKWETHDPMLPEPEYACGRRAYDAIMAALQSGDYYPPEAWSVLCAYAGYKRDIAQYMNELRNLLPNTETIASHYSEVSRIWNDIIGAGQEALGGQLPLFAEAKLAEEHGIQAIRALMKETIENRFDDTGLR